MMIGTTYVVLDLGAQTERERGKDRSGAEFSSVWLT